MIAAVLISAAGVSALAWAASDRAHGAHFRDDPANPVASVQRGDLRYEYHAVMGRGRLVDVRTGDAVTDDATEQKLRAELVEHLGISSIDELRTRYADEIRRLHAAGYL